MCYQFAFNTSYRKAKVTDYIPDSTSTKVPPEALKPHFIDIIVKEGIYSFPMSRNKKRKNPRMNCEV